MDDKIFVISNIQVSIEILFKIEVVSFEGASEWALDSLVLSEVVWLPREDQLREMLQAILINSENPEIRLISSSKNSLLEFEFNGIEHTFNEKNASEAYAKALLETLNQVEWIKIKRILMGENPDFSVH